MSSSMSMQRLTQGSSELIIADEPTSALDTQNRESFIKLLFEQAKKSNSTLVFVSHDETLKPLFSRTIYLVNLQGDVLLYLNLPIKVC